MVVLSFYKDVKIKIYLKIVCEDKSIGLKDGIPISERDSAIETPTVNNHENINVGRHETLQYYQDCISTKRNPYLYTGELKIPLNASRKYTRQNQHGTKYGFECPEERDYYPYWHASKKLYFINN